MQLAKHLEVYNHFKPRQRHSNKFNTFRLQEDPLQNHDALGVDVLPMEA